MYEKLLRYVLLPIFGLLCIGGTVFSAKSSIRSISSTCAATGPQIHNDFDWSLFKAVFKSDRNNIVLSTISVKLVLAMVYLGASGNTAKELERILYVTNMGGRKKTFEKFRKILDALKEQQPGYELDIGTKLFIDKTATIREKFQIDLRGYFNSNLDIVNFKQRTKAMTVINNWSKHATHGKIDNLVSEGDTKEDTIMLLVNAVFFKGIWETPFPVMATKPGQFTLSNGMKVEATFMGVVGTFGYVNSSELNAEIVRIPYMGQKYAMYLLLPHSQTGLPGLVERLSPTSLQKGVTKMQNLNIFLKLPKFHFESTAILTPVLKQLGLKEIFSPNANLSGIGFSSQGYLKVSNVVQRAGLDVNEQGSTLFAATQVGFVTRIGESVVAEVKVQHPFAFAIFDEKNCIVTFIGKVVNPQVEEDFFVESRFAAPSYPISRLPPKYRRPNQKRYKRASVDKFEYFDTEFLQKMSQLSTGNILVSPESVKSALALILEGSKGNTETELKDVLGLPYDKTALTHLLSKRLLALKKKSPNVTLEFQSGIFLSRNEKLSPQYLQNVQKQYYSDLELVDFRYPATVSGTINKWINSATNSLIPDLIDSGNLNSQMKLLLANCLYFQGEWFQEFEIQNTREECFYPNNDNVCRTVNMMHLKTDLNYKSIENLNAEVVEMPFKDRSYAMIIVLPIRRDGLQNLLNDLSHTTLRKILADARKVEVNLTLPRFSIDYSNSLVTGLQSLGIKKIFTNQANLTAILRENAPLAVNDIIHRAKIEVNERGSPAMVAPVITLSIPYTIPFKANHPFVFFIQDKKTGGNILEGIVNSPDPAVKTQNSQRRVGISKT